MTLGYIGLGKMGANMVKRLLEKHHNIVAFDVNKKAVTSARRSGAVGASSLSELVSHLKGPRTIWVMVPHKFVDVVLSELLPLLKKGDTVIDGGNSPYKDSMKRSKRLAKKGIKFLDVGVSGGPDGARNGACMMIGGKKADYKKLEKLFRDACAKDAYGYMGTVGAGHFVKMVHNGIEYGMMQSIAEGFAVMQKKKGFGLNVKEIARVYGEQSVISSRLIDWLQTGYEEFGIELKGVSRTAIGTGEGKWTVEEAKRLGIPVKVIKESWRARKRSEKKPNDQAQIIMTLRNQFGGHSIDSL